MEIQMQLVTSLAANAKCNFLLDWKWQKKISNTKRRPHRKSPHQL